MQAVHWDFMQMHYKNYSYSIINSVDRGVVISVIPLMFSVQIVADNTCVYIFFKSNLTHNTSLHFKHLIRDLVRLSPPHPPPPRFHWMDWYMLPIKNKPLNFADSALHYRGSHRFKEEGEGNVHVGVALSQRAVVRGAAPPDLCL